MENNSNTSVYVDTGEVVSWSEELHSLNTGAVDILNKFQTRLDKIDEVMIGNIATGVYENLSKLLTIGKNYHNNMKEVETFLVGVVNTMKNE